MLVPLPLLVLPLLLPLLPPLLLVLVVVLLLSPSLWLQVQMLARTLEGAQLV